MDVVLFVVENVFDRALRKWVSYLLAWKHGWHVSPLSLIVWVSLRLC